MPNKYLVSIIILIFVFLVSSGFYILMNMRGISSSLRETESKQETTSDPTDLFNKGDFKTLNTTLDSQLKSNPNNIQLLLQKAQALAQEASLTFREKELGNEALVYIDQVLSIDPKNIEALTLKGYVYEIQQDYVKAHRYYDEALKLDPKNVDTLTQKAHAYDLEGKTKEAQSLYSKIPMSDASNDLKMKQARLFMLTNPTSARQLLLQVVESDEDNSRMLAEAYGNLGSLEENSVYSKAAEEYYRKSISNDPTLASGHVGLARELFKKTSTTEQIDLKDEYLDSSFKSLETALQLNPNQTTASLQLGIQLLSVGEKGLALKVLTNAVNNVSNDISLNANDKTAISIVLQQIINNNK